MESDATHMILPVERMDVLVSEWEKNTSDSSSVPGVLQRRQAALDWLAQNIRADSLSSADYQVFASHGSISFTGTPQEILTLKNFHDRLCAQAEETANLLDEEEVLS